MAQNNTPSTTLTLEQQAQLLALVETLRKEKDAAEKALAEEKAKKSGRVVSLKISEKGAVSLYGVGRFPFSPYRSQWIRIFELKDMILKFIEDNKDVLDMVEEEKEERAAAEKAAKTAPAAPPPATTTTTGGKLTFAEWKARQAK